MFERVCWSTRFGKDYRKAMKRGKNMVKLDNVLEMLEKGRLLPRELKDHPLSGDMAGFRELHIEPDWLLIYGVLSDTLTFVRTGSHADLFR